jgi:hypothetical protein
LGSSLCQKRPTDIFNEPDFQKFENNAGVKRLIDLGNALINTNGPQTRADTQQIIFQLKRKYDKATDLAIGQGQNSDTRYYRFTEYTRSYENLSHKFSNATPNDGTGRLTEIEKTEFRTHLAMIRIGYS